MEMADGGCDGLGDRVPGMLGKRTGHRAAAMMLFNAYSNTTTGLYVAVLFVIVSAIYDFQFPIMQLWRPIGL
jgi:hypothetical protein